jgi:mannose-6-phosphate isomerase-like protein (cupin superfamily)
MNLQKLRRALYARGFICAMTGRKEPPDPDTLYHFSWRKTRGLICPGNIQWILPEKEGVFRACRCVKLRFIEMPNSPPPRAADYQNEPVRYPALQILDVLAEAWAIEERYRNLVLNRINNHCLRLAVIQGDYPWHCHPHSDELFLIVEGCLFIDLADGRELRLGPWQSVTIPANTAHRTRAASRTVNLCFEELAADTIFLETPRDNILSS